MQRFQAQALTFSAVKPSPTFSTKSAKRGHSRELLQCVDTYASLLLTTGIAPIGWIAEQMEHTNGNMIRQHYGTWINDDGPDVVGMLQLALKLSPVAVLQ